MSRGILVALALASPAAAEFEVGTPAPLTEAMSRLKLAPPRPERAGTVSLWVTDIGKLTGGDGMLRWFLDRRFAASDQPDKELVVVRNSQGFRDLLWSYKRKGVAIRNLTILSHSVKGSPEIQPSWELGELERLELHAAFAPEAEILIYGCQTGQGVSGAAYLKRLGGALLAGGGGTVTAPKWYYAVWDPFITYGSPGGWQRYRVRPGGEGELSTPVDAERTRLDFLALASSYRDALASGPGESGHEGFDRDDCASSLRLAGAAAELLSETPASLGRLASAEVLLDQLSGSRCANGALSPIPSTPLAP